MSRHLSRWRHWLLLAAGWGGVGVLLLLNLYREHAHIEAEERTRLITQSKVVEDNLSRQLMAINRAMESILGELPDWARLADGPALASQRLKRMELSMPSVRTFLVLNAQGVATASSRAELVGRSFDQRTYFQVHVASIDPQRLHVSEPFLSLLNTYVITLSRAILSPSGEFLGVVSATIDPIDIQILLNSVRYADDMRSMLVHGDGKVFVSQPVLNQLLGMDVSTPGSFFRRHLDSQRPVNSFAGIAPSTGDRRLPVLRTIQPAELAMDKPLVVSLSRSWEALFAEWQGAVRNTLLGYVLLVLLSIFGLIVYRGQQAHKRTINLRLKLATEAAGVGIWEYAPAERRYHWDPAMFALFGLDPQAASRLNDEWKQLLLPGELARIRDATRAVIQHRQPLDLTFQIRQPAGQVRYLRNRAALHVGDPGAPVRLIGSTEDVTERKTREADLRIAATAFESHECMVITDAAGVIIRVNQAFSAMFGYTASEALGQTPRLLQSGRHDPAFYANLWDSIQHNHAWQGEIWNRRKNGDLLLVWLSVSAVCTEDGVVTHFVATHTDITLRRAAEDEIRHMAFYDPLTQLPNRRLLHDRLHQAVALAKRDAHRLALMFIDLDKFKPINDEFGHPAGDELLLAVAQRLRACTRESDTTARVGGDEFVVLLPHIEAVQDALAVAEKIQMALRQPFALANGVTAHISSSAGIAIYPDHADDEAVLTRHADAAMYQAKTAGRDRFILFSPTPIELPREETP